MGTPRFNIHYSTYVGLKENYFYLGKLDEQLFWLDKQLTNIKVSDYKAATHIVSDGENLRNITRKYYGDVSLWKKLAKYNRIDDLSIASGDLLKIPDRSRL